MKVYTSKYDEDIFKQARAKKERIDPEAHVGAANQFFITKKFGLRMDFRSVWIFDIPGSLISFFTVAGLFLSF
jgi:hypothetical protein